MMNCEGHAQGVFRDYYLDNVYSNNTNKHLVTASHLKRKYINENILTALKLHR